jgi:uncharacterized protein DUF4115
MAVPAYPADEEPRRLMFETCSIVRWRGYVSSTFVALLEDGTPIAESASFRARGAAAPPDAGEAREAFDGLCSTLDALGWDFRGDPADAWYAVRFTRPVEVVAETPPEAAPPPPATRQIAPPQLAPPQLVPPEPAPPRPAAPPPAAPVVAEPPAAPPELPPAAGATARPGRPSRRIVVVSTLGIAAAVALGGYLELRPSGQHASPPAPAAAARTPKLHVAAPAHAVPVRVPARKPAPPAPPALARIDISAPERASWLEVRRGSATGPVLFSGELAPGRHLHLTGKRLWARFGAASNLAIRSNGRPVSFTGTYEHLFAAAKK